MQKLPIDEVLPTILHALSQSPAVIVQAPPGAGKTTRLPLALLEAPFLADRKIVMLEPRRLAAVNAARWMAALLGEEVGQTVGYGIRFERKVSSATRIEVLTEGLFARRLQSDPFLEGVGAVIFDEFHERSLQSDLSLALCRDAQIGLREDLRIIVMSATLDGDPLGRLLGDAPVITSAGKSFPVAVRYLPTTEDERTIVEATFRAVLHALRETAGDILVFLPGVSEIRRCQRLLEGYENLPDATLICPLYGDLPFAAQELAIMPTSRRKVVLATNIAETSLTIEGVGVVIDSGFARQLRFDPATGINRLLTVRVSAASAAQRTGRAGRLGPGISYRLWSEHTQRGLLPFTVPEIRSADLSLLALELAQWGITDPGSLAWLDPPPAALAEGRRLLQRLGALDNSLLITVSGKRMAELPTHPRLAHLLLVAEALGYGSIACDLAAILTERDILRGAATLSARQVSDSDLLDRLDALGEWRRNGRGNDIDAGACWAVDRAAGQLRRLLRCRDVAGEVDAELVGRLLIQAYPDRIGRQRDPGANRYLLTNGQGGALSRRSALHNNQYLVAVQVEGGERGEGAIHLASALTLETIRRECAVGITRQRIVAWDSGEGRVVAREEERLDAITLESRPVTPSREEVSSALVQGVVSGPGLAALNWTHQATQFRARVAFLARHASEKVWPDFSAERLTINLAEWLGPYLAGVRSLEGLTRIDLLPPLKAQLSWEQQRLLDEGAPTHLTVPSGSHISLDYTAEMPPVLAVKLQEMFGLGDTPSVAWGRVPVLIHLLSPARRPIQVTRDLRGFWDSTYREVKKELKGRYPKHPWPDDPWNAPPAKGTKRRVKGEG